MTTGERMMMAQGMRALVALALVATPVAATAKSANELRDLVGARAAGAENDLESRGWVSISNHRDGDRSQNYWWNPSRKDCVRVTTRDGRYQAITDAGASDCNQKGGSDGAVAAAVGVAALIGVLALSHKSHHRDDKEYQNQNDYADFERGHRDGLYNHSYSNDRRSDAYSDGYQSGVNERNHQSSYRPEYRQYRDGYQNSNYGESGNGGDDFSSLVGQRASGVESDLQRRGFRSVDGFESGRNAKGAIWWNGRTRQCLQVITADGRADSVNDIQTHPRCR
ncbi:hypothetical protein [Polymorphobacter sp.]|uniref:hypothetical protein n=1 Tax=Polymorphobacter sp. TaxID=1909290 RepID=UPI003F6E4554